MTTKQVGAPTDAHAWVLSHHGRPPDDKSDRVWPGRSCYSRRYNQGPGNHRHQRRGQPNTSPTTIARHGFPGAQARSPDSAAAQHFDPHEAADRHDQHKPTQPAPGHRVPETVPYEQKSQVNGHIPGSRDRTRTYNLPVNSRTLCRLSYAGSRGTGGAEPASATALPGSPAGVPLCRRPAYPCRDLRVAYPRGSRARRGAEGLSGARVAPFRAGPGTYRVRPGGGS